MHARKLRLALGVILTLGLCACSSGGGTAPGHSTSGSFGSALSCVHPADTVNTDDPVAKMELPHASAWQLIPVHMTPAPCGTDVSVTSADGAAQLVFSRQGRCKLTEDSQAPGTATLTTRQPRGDLFNQGAGSTLCTLTAGHQTQTIHLCGLATLSPHGPHPQFEGSCYSSDPDLTVAVWSDSVTLIDRHGRPHVIDAGFELSYDFTTASWQPLAEAHFSTAAIETFDEQAQALGAEITMDSQTVAFTSVPPPSPTPGQTYTVSATGGASGNAVLFSIDQSSLKVCSATTSSPQTAIVTFDVPGTCVIDATQMGSSYYLPAPQVQQSVTVVPVTPS